MAIQKKIQQKLQEISERSDIDLDWRKIKTTISQMGNCKELTQKKKLKIWDNE
jgi:hypothetical protein